MQPLSVSRRRTYLWSLLVVFFISFPLIILYATGYRFTKDFLWVETGGIFVAVENAGSTLYINDEVVGTSTFLDRQFLRQNLKPGVYSVRVEREGDYSWNKILSVDPYIVTDAQAISIPQVIEKTNIVLDSTRPKTATTTPPGIEYMSTSSRTALLNLFVVSTTTRAKREMATSTVVAQEGEISLVIENDNLLARFGGATTSAPSQFCKTPRNCVSDILLEQTREPVLSANFLLGNQGIAIYTTGSGIYLSEVDIRSPKLLVPLHQVAGSDFRFSGNSLIIKEGRELYRVSPW